MYVDFTDLKNTCPNDHYPAPDLKSMVNANARLALFGFINAFLGYNQIPMHEPDQPSIAFFINRSLCYYRIMPFGLKYTEYQRLVNKIF